jgi:xanthosine utilization system XapX-like protein
MIETLLFLSGAVAGILFAALRMRVPGEPWLDTLVRPLSGGGPRPGTPR